MAGRLGDELVEEIVTYIIETGATLRETAKKFNISKSTVHNCCRKHIKSISSTLHPNVMKVLEENKRKRHFRGGESTKLYNEKKEHENILKLVQEKFDELQIGNESNFIEQELDNKVMKHILQKRTPPATKIAKRERQMQSEIQNMIAEKFRELGITYDGGNGENGTVE